VNVCTPITRVRETTNIRSAGGRRRHSEGCLGGAGTGVDSFASHTLPLAGAPHAYDILQKKQDGR
jgi:hypothetical protein